MQEARILAPQSQSDWQALAAIGRDVRGRVSSDTQLRKLDAPSIEIWRADGFITAPVCQRLMALIDEVACPSRLVDTEGWENYRTSYSGDIDPDNADVIALNSGLDRCLGIEPDWGENLQGQRYRPGEYYHPHCDWFDTSAPYWDREDQCGGQRSWTAMIYLNGVDAGGETHFTALDLKFTPCPGTLLLWNNTLPDGSPNPATVHAAKKVLIGTKYVVTKWYRARPWRLRAGLGFGFPGFPVLAFKHDHQRIEPAVKPQDFQLGAQVDLVIVARGDAVLLGLPVLAHHDHRRLDRRQHRQHQVEEDVGIGIERMQPQIVQQRLLISIQPTSTTPKAMMNPQLPPTAATRSASRSPKLERAARLPPAHRGPMTVPEAMRVEHALLLGVQLVEVAAEQFLAKLLSASRAYASSASRHASQRLGDQLARFGDAVKRDEAAHARPLR